MNLQVNSPYTKCPYRCPYCVAGVTADYPFPDTMYNEQPRHYFATLALIVLVNHVENVIITGSTEPTLFPKWIEQVCNTLRSFNVGIELQTKNYNWTETFGRINVIAYSHDCIPTHERPKHNCTIRDVFLWNKALTSSMIIKYFQGQPNVDQCTVKQLVSSSYNIPAIDAYIKQIDKRLTFTDKLILKENGIWIDEDCAASDGRYQIYRTDGNLYQKWSDTKPIG